MSLPYYTADQISERHGEIAGALRRQPTWGLRAGLVEGWLKGVPKDARIVDIGSGSGELERQLVALGYANLTSVDIDDYLDRAAIGASPAFVKADVSRDRIDLPDASQDVAFALQMFEHLENPWHCAREILRVVKPGGRIIVSIPHATSFANRWTFFRTGEIDSYSIKNNHISLFSNALFHLLWKGQAKILRTETSEGYIKLGFGKKIRFRPETRLGRAFARKIAYVMERA